MSRLRAGGDAFARNHFPDGDGDPDPNGGQVGGQNRGDYGADTLAPRTRRRRGSLRKAALLGRGAMRERREANQALEDGGDSEGYDGQGLGISMITPRAAATATATAVVIAAGAGAETKTATVTAALLSPTPKSAKQASTLLRHANDEDDDLIQESASKSSHSSASSSTSASASASAIGGSLMSAAAAAATAAATSLLRADLRLSTNSHASTATSEPLGTFLPSLRQRRLESSQAQAQQTKTQGLLSQQQHRAKSPLSLTDLAPAPLPPSSSAAALADADWDYSETEWWGWVMLVVTWVVFVIGMGSCFGVWSWAWDVGTTPYAPPELEDDPTLPIVGYYPALMILTCVMAWVWVVIAWIGMKYFRHAKISGD